MIKIKKITSTHFFLFCLCSTNTEKGTMYIAHGNNDGFGHILPVCIRTTLKKNSTHCTLVRPEEFPSTNTSTDEELFPLSLWLWHDTATRGERQRCCAHSKCPLLCPAVHGQSRPYCTSQGSAVSCSRSTHVVVVDEQRDVVDECVILCSVTTGCIFFSLHGGRMPHLSVSW